MPRRPSNLTPEQKKERNRLYQQKFRNKNKTGKGRGRPKTNFLTEEEKVVLRKLKYKIKKVKEPLTKIFKYLKNKRDNRMILDFLGIGDSAEPASMRRPVVETENMKGYKSLLSNQRVSIKDDGVLNTRVLNNQIPSLLKRLRDSGPFKMQLTYEVKTEKSDGRDGKPFIYNTKFQIISNKYELLEALRDSSDFLQSKFDGEADMEESVFFKGIEAASVKVASYTPLSGSSYIDLPEWIRNRKCCINIKNNDNLCFLYCLIYHFEKIAKDPQRVTKYHQFIDKYNQPHFTYPMEIDKIHHVETVFDIGINVYTIDGCITPVRISEHESTERMSLLYIKNDETGHYVYIKNFSVLVAKYPNQYKRFFCERCLSSFSRKEMLTNHMEDCESHQSTRIKMPEEGAKLKFKNFSKKFKLPVAIYADFETLVKPVSNALQKPGQSSTDIISRLDEVCSFAYRVVSDIPELNLGYFSYRGVEADQQFIDSLLKHTDFIKNYVKETDKSMIGVPSGWDEAETCHICEKRFQDSDMKVRDHCHLSGVFRGTAHQDCNLNLNNANFKVPVYFHNLKNFDGHFIINALKKRNFSNITMIAQNFEKYMTIQVGNICFLDSFAFLSSSLEKLAESLDESDFKYSTDQLLRKKGVYPYSYFSDHAKFEDGLPSKEHFYSDLTESHITDEEFRHANNVYDTYKCQNMGDYHDIYLKTDVDLLADIFENFRNFCLENYKLDPGNRYITLPQFSWDAMLYKTGIELDLISDINQYMFLEKGIRGGISMIFNRHAEANNKYMKNYDQTKEDSYIAYLDANNLYGHSMIQSLPYKNFKWVDDVSKLPAYNFEPWHMDSLEIGIKNNLLNGVECNEFIGKHGLKYLDHILEMELYKNTEDWNECAQLTAYRNLFNNEGVAKVKYQRNAPYGRCNAVKALGLHSIRRQIRHLVCRELYFDIDIVNCHPSMLYQICKKFNIQCKYLDLYVNNRDSCLENVMEKYNVGRDVAKKLYLSIMFGSNGLGWIQEYGGGGVLNSDIAGLVEEMDAIYHVLKESNKALFEWVSSRKEKNVKGSFLSYYLQEVEVRVLECVYKHCLDAGYIQNNVVVLASDGIMLSKEYINQPDSVCGELAKVVRDVIGLGLEFMVKEMNEALDVDLPSSKPEQIPKIECEAVSKSYILEVDLEYPMELHDSHNSYPLAPESMCVEEDMLSPYLLKNLEIYKSKHNSTIKKLIPNLNFKEKYVVTMQNLKYYLSKGLKLKKIHRVLEFEEKAWLKPYIDFNTMMRAKSKTDFQKDMFKLMNNSCFGKFMENVRKRVDIQLHTNEKMIKKRINSPLFEGFRVYQEDELVAIKKSKTQVTLDKPIYVGMCILDYSKLHMYKFHYDYMLPKYGDNQQLLFTDTDSLCYHIKTEDVYKDMDDDRHLFDKSAYKLDGYRSVDNANKKVVGKFKDETNGVPIIEFCGLASKMYSILLENDVEKKTGKGIKKSALKKLIKHQDYKACLFQQGLGRQNVSFNNMRSIDHNVSIYRFTKIGLTNRNDKVYLHDNGVTSYSYGHYKIPVSPAVN